MPALVDPSDAAETGRALGVVESVLTAARVVDGHDAVDEAALRRLRGHGLASSRLWLAGDDGFAWRRDGELDLVVRPSARSTGVATSLAVLATQARGALTAWSHGDAPAARRLAPRLGLAPTRSLWVMRRSLAALPSLRVPPALTIRGYLARDAADVLRINASAFARHPEQGQMDTVDLAERMAEPWFDPAGLLLAQDAEGVHGFHWTKRHSATLGEVYVVGIDPDAQGRGLGRVLTLAGLHHLAESGATDVLLYVESDNLPALAVYAGLGFEHTDRDTHVQYSRP